MAALAGELGMLCSALGNFPGAFPLGFLPDGAGGRFFLVVLQQSSRDDLPSCFLLPCSPCPTSCRGS